MRSCGWIVFAFGAAALMIFLAAPRIIARRRDSEYRRYEDASRSAIVAEFPLPSVAGGLTSPLERALADLANAEHREAVLAQNEYQSALARSAACLLLASCALALTCASLDKLHSITVMRSLMSVECLHSIHLGLAGIDAISIALLIILYWHAHRASRRWIALRIRAELLRQFRFLMVVFPQAVGQDGARDITSRFSEEADRIDKRVLSGPFATMELRIHEFWQERRSAIEKGRQSDARRSATALLSYLAKRPRRQLGWFTDSMERLKDAARRRKNRLEKLYYVVCALAVVKLLLELVPGSVYGNGDVLILSLPGLHAALSALILPVLLILTAWSAVETVYYLNQNARSLLHRYKFQTEKIRGWLRSFNAAMPFEQLAANVVDTENVTSAMILTFEESLIEELIEWVHVSSHDVIEIAP
jgi:hypothetical protein